MSGFHATENKSDQLRITNIFCSWLLGMCYFQTLPNKHTPEKRKEKGRHGGRYSWQITRDSITPCGWVLYCVGSASALRKVLKWQPYFISIQHDGFQKAAYFLTSAFYHLWVMQCSVSHLIKKEMDSRNRHWWKVKMQESFLSKVFRLHNVQHTTARQGRHSQTYFYVGHVTRDPPAKTECIDWRIMWNNLSNST